MWRRVLLEGLVIVGSILLAFALDAWWEGREFRRELVRELDSVGRELEINGDLVDFQIDFMERQESARQALLEMMDNGHRGPSITVPDTLVFWVTNTPTLDASLGAVDALIASGRLASIEDPELRAGLAGLRDRIADAIEEQLVARSIYLEQVLPLIRHLPQDQSLQVSREFWAAERTLGGGVPTYGTAQFASTAEVAHLLAIQGAWYDVSLGEMRSLVAEFEDLRRRLAALR